MSLENQSVDYKSLRVITGKTADWGELAKDCVAFASAQGGRLLIGIEDGDGTATTAQGCPANRTHKRHAVLHRSEVVA